LPRATGTVGWRSFRRIRDRPTITATYDAAFTSKHTDRPTKAMRAPPMAGPMTRAEFITTLLRLTAFGRSSRPTSSSTKVWRAGLSTRFTNPRKVASMKTCHSRTAPTAVNNPRVRARIPATDCVQYSSRRLSTRSAMSPPQVPNRSMGRNCSAVTSPR
jgi:hypothetical protein